MSLFEQKYHNDERGAAYPPRLLLKTILYCYSRGIITSIRIEKAYHDSIIVKALAEDIEPAHDTIAADLRKKRDKLKKYIERISPKPSGYAGRVVLCAGVFFDSFPKT
jgi:transposase